MLPGKFEQGEVIEAGLFSIQAIQAKDQNQVFPLCRQSFCLQVFPNSDMLAQRLSTGINQDFILFSGIALVASIYQVVIITLKVLKFRLAFWFDMIYAKSG